MVKTKGKEIAEAGVADMTATGDDFQKPAQGLLIEAVRANDLEAAEDLLRRGADVNERNQFGVTSLMFAAADGFTSMVQLLIENNADVDAVSNLGRAARDGAVTRRHPDVLRLLEKAPEIRRRVAEEKTRAEKVAAADVMADVAAQQHAVASNKQQWLKQKAWNRPINPY